MAAIGEIVREIIRQFEGHRLVSIPCRSASCVQLRKVNRDPMSPNNVPLRHPRVSGDR